MVGYAPDKEKLPSSVYMASGAISGVVARSVGQPLDVLKIRFQLHVNPIGISTTAKYQGIVHGVGRIYREEGIRAFWKGHVPAQALSVIYGVVQFAAFEYLTKQVWHQLPSYFTTDLRPVTHFACGGLAGSLATVVCQPCDVIRTRFVAQGNNKIYTSMNHALISIVKEEGFRGLYRGLVPAVLQVAPNTALQFGFYTLLNGAWKNLISPSNDKYNIGSMESFVCGGGSGFLSKLIIYPLDLTKKRLQVQGFEKGWSHVGDTRTYSGLTDCIKSVIKEEGFIGLYKGLSPSLMKAIVVSAVTFWCYELTVDLLGTAYRNDKDS